MNYTDKLENNPYISDQAAYQEVTTLLKEKEQPQFIHLVTMQTHMPYENKYTTSIIFLKETAIKSRSIITCKILPTVAKL